MKEQNVSNVSNVSNEVNEVFNNYSNGKSDKMKHKTAPETAKETANKYGNVIDSKTNRKVAIIVLDSTLRGFKQNCETLFKCRNNTAVCRLLAEKNIPSKMFASYKELSNYIHKYGKDRYIDNNGKICHEKVALSKNTNKIEYYTNLGYTIRYNEDKTKAVALVPAISWSVSQFITMVANCRKVELKQNNNKTQKSEPNNADIQNYLNSCLAQLNK